MNENGNSSFIPRQTPSSGRRSRTKRSIGLLGYASYIIFIGALLAAVGMFFYSQYIQSQLAAKQAELEVVKNQFDQAEMRRVQEFEQFLNTVDTLYYRSIVIEKLFTTIEEAMADGAVLSSLQIDNNSDQLLVQAEVVADSFDTALFQRSVYEEYPLLSSFNLENVLLADSAGAEGSTSGDTVTFSLLFDIPASELSFANVESFYQQDDLDRTSVFGDLEDDDTDIDDNSADTSEEVEESVDQSDDLDNEENI